MSNYTNGPETTDRTALLVLGMHRSGTSALTRVLSLLGADLPANLFPAHPSNPTGHWESLDWIALHDEVLSKYGRSWDSPMPLPKEASRPETLAPFCVRLATLLRRDFSDSKMFVAKDPRLCRLLPLWRKALEEVGFAPRYILMVRHPLEVAASLAIRNQMSSTAALLLWMRHLVESERATRGEPRIFVSYDALLNDWQSVAARIAERFNFQWPVKPADAAAQVDAFLRRDLRHHSLNGDSELEEYTWPKALYSAASGPFDEAQLTTFDEIGRNLVEFDRYADPVLLEYRDQWVKSLGAELQTLREETHSLNERSSQREAEISGIFSARDAELLRLKDDLSARNAELAARDAELLRLKDDLSARNAELAARDGEPLRLKDDLSARNAYAVGLVGQVSALDAELISLRAELSTRDAQLLGARDELSTRDAQLLGVRDELSTRDAQLLGLRDELSTRNAELSRSRGETWARSAELQTLEKGIRRLNSLWGWKMMRIFHPSLKRRLASRG